MEKVNYYKKLEEIIEGNHEVIPRLLLHSCCAPCSSSVLEYLTSFFKVTIFYYNPNISPEDEYQKRMLEQQDFVNRFTTTYPVTFVCGTYDPISFFRMSKGFEDEKEGGIRCTKCYEMRLRETVRFAKLHGFDYFGTTLSVSPYKNASKLNEIGKQLEEEFEIPYLYSDFKKNEGYKRSIELSREYGLYRQDYCGCIYSRKCTNNS